MTKIEAKARFVTAQSAEEVADLLLECFKIFGYERTEQILTEISTGDDSTPYLH